MTTVSSWDYIAEEASECRTVSALRALCHVTNRRIAKEELDIFEPDNSAKAIIEAQDRKIAALSGRPRGPIKSISRAAAR